MNIVDSTGREIKKGQLVHLPANAMPEPIFVAEVVDIIEPSTLITGQPQRPACVMLEMRLVVPVNPRTNSVPYCYIVGERHRKDQPNSLDKDKGALKLVSEEPPDGIELPDKGPKVQ